MVQMAFLPASRKAAKAAALTEPLLKKKIEFLFLICYIMVSKSVKEKKNEDRKKEKR
jgi:hypothetical protein